MARLGWCSSRSMRGLQRLKGEIGLDLYRGTSLEEAKQLARFLNSNIKSVSYRSS